MAGELAAQKEGINPEAAEGRHPEHVVRASSTKLSTDDVENSEN
jgi:hypothetical protein